jgi:hypothetical protein
MTDHDKESERDSSVDETPEAEPQRPAQTAQPAPTPVEEEEETVPGLRRTKRWAKQAALWIVLGAALLFSLWAAITLNYTYESGERTGFVRTLSKEGWICKTWEGELASAQPLDTVPRFFSFTVRNDSVARVIQRTIGERVALQFERHLGLPGRCFGETEYFITGVRILPRQ